MKEAISLTGKLVSGCRNNMKILVDETPNNERECIFSWFENYEDTWHCVLVNDFCAFKERWGCPYLAEQ